MAVEARRAFGAGHRELPRGWVHHVPTETSVVGGSCPSHFQVSNRKKKMPTFLNLLVLILELSGRCGASSRRSCGNVTFRVDVGVLCIKRSVSRVTKKPKNMKTGEAQKKKDTV